jgi:hypothetical protein
MAQVAAANSGVVREPFPVATATIRFRYNAAFQHP